MPVDLGAHTLLPDTSVGDALPVKGSIDGGLDFRCRPPDCLLVAGCPSIMGEGVAWVSNELEAPEY